MPNAAFGIIRMSKVLQMSLDWPRDSGPALFTLLWPEPLFTAPPKHVLPRHSFPLKVVSVP